MYKKGLLITPSTSQTSVAPMTHIPAGGERRLPRSLWRPKGIFGRRKTRGSFSEVPKMKSRASYIGYRKRRFKRTPQVNKKALAIGGAGLLAFLLL